jgi:hypothetical protein
MWNGSTSDRGVHSPLRIHCGSGSDGVLEMGVRTGHVDKHHSHSSLDNRIAEALVVRTDHRDSVVVADSHLLERHEAEGPWTEDEHIDPGYRTSHEEVVECGVCTPGSGCSHGVDGDSRSHRAQVGNCGVALESESGSDRDGHRLAATRLLMTDASILNETAKPTSATQRTTWPLNSV